MRSLRVAFLTNEFPSESHSAGGLGSYLDRITRALLRLGHRPEVLVVHYGGEPGVLDWGGVFVERVAAPEPAALRLAQRLARVHPRLCLRDTALRLRESLALAAALARREREVRFDFVQSSNCGLAGLLVPRRAERPHLLRLSSARDLCHAAASRPRGLDARLVEWLEGRCVRRADLCCAPSRLVAGHVSGKLGVAVEVLRPPAALEVEPDKAPGPGLPERYLLHFGRIGRLKGSDLLARALPLAWREEPGLSMVWAGALERGAAFAQLAAGWGAHEGRVRWLGRVEKPRLYAILRGALASVLPSRADNFPNTALESLLLGVPVIATRGASFEELVEPGRSGALVAQEDAPALAAQLVAAWRGEAPWLAAGFQRPALLDELEPERAARALIRLAGIPA